MGLFSAGILLLIASPGWGWTGPCTDRGDPCGGVYDGTEDTCTGMSDCGEKNCPNFCPEGENWEYCAHVSGSCTASWVPCSEYLLSVCQATGHGIRYCSCFQTETGSGEWCYRLDC